jgi:membrane associated rhomboid family serine protease
MKNSSKNSRPRNLFTPVVGYLMIVNIAIYVPGVLFEGFDNWLVFEPGMMGSRPWAGITHMFIHANLAHLAGNMLMLLHFGPELERRWGGSEFGKLYLFCGVGGVALHSLFYPNLGLLGASGAIYGVSFVSALKSPNAAIYLLGIFPPVRAKYIMGLAATLTLAYIVSPVADGVSYAAHLGGMAAGPIYLRYLGLNSRPGALLRTEEIPQPGALDTHITLRVTLAQATGGSGIMIRAGGGEEVLLTIPKGTVSGTHLRVPGGGTKKAGTVGDQWVRIKIQD